METRVQPTMPCTPAQQASESVSLSVGSDRFRANRLVEGVGVEALRAQAVLVSEMVEPTQIALRKETCAQTQSPELHTISSSSLHPRPGNHTCTNALLLERKCWSLTLQTTTVARPTDLVRAQDLVVGPLSSERGEVVALREPVHVGWTREGLCVEGAVSASACGVRSVGGRGG